MLFRAKRTALTTSALMDSNESIRLSVLTRHCDINAQIGLHAKPLVLDIRLKHLANVALVRYTQSIGFGLDRRKQTLR